MGNTGQTGGHSGFPSPAQDYMDSFISLDKELVRHPAATFYARVTGDSMSEAGVEKGDILVIDKSLEPRDGDMALCFIDGEFMLRHISFKEPSTKSLKAGKPGKSYDILPRRKAWLLASDGTSPVIEVGESNDFTIWGIVSYVIKRVCTH